MKIIGIAGRKGGGKSTLGKELISRGYTRISFADFLKESCSELFDIPLSSFYNVVEKESLFDNPYIWDIDKCKKLEKIVSIKIKFSGEKALKNIREILQFVGTDILRKYDTNIHIKKTRERILNLDKCFIDDIRFPNEKAMIEELGGICIFLLRPSNWNYSNHESEISLSRTDFDYILINNTTETSLLYRFRMFINNLDKKSSRPANVPSKDKLIAGLENYGSPTLLAKQWNCSRDKIVWWAYAYMVPLPIGNQKYLCNHQDKFLIPTEESAYWAGVISADGCVKQSGKTNTNSISYTLSLECLDYELANGLKTFVGLTKPLYSRAQKANGKIRYSCIINNPYIVEDMKLWEIFPRKSKHNKVPDLIRNNDCLISQWIVGLIDGDGCIFYDSKEQKNVLINLLASKEVIEFIKDWVDLPCSMRNHKHIPNLYEITFCGKNAVSLYKKIYMGRGLHRKWSKIEPFLNKNWHH